MAATEFVCTVKETQPLTPTVFKLVFETDKPFMFDAGQYISVVIPGAGPGGRNLRRAYSIASAPEMKQVELCVKYVENGPGSGYLAKQKVGDIFRGAAPYGDFVYEPKAEKQFCFIGTGTGIAPIRSILLSKAFSEHRPIRALCLYGARSQDEILYQEDLSNNSLFDYSIALSQPQNGWNGFRGRVTDYVRTLERSYPWTQSEFFLCGSGDMIEEVKEFLEDRGVLKECIHHEVYYK
jgi:ferredoxin-NADP reductase